MAQQKYPIMKPEEIKELRYMMGILHTPRQAKATITEAASEIGVSLRTWQYWEAGETRPLRLYNKALWELKEKLTKQLKEKQGNE